jgi:hypothetical protein
MILLLFLAQIEVTAELKGEYINKTLTIGDPFEITVTAQHPAGTQISEPFVDSMGLFSMIDQSSRSIEEKGVVSSIYNFRLVPFGTGELQIPAFRFLVEHEDAVDTLSSNRIELKIASVMPDDMQEINDIKRAIEFPNLLPLIIAGIIVASFVLGYLAYRFIRKLKGIHVVPETKPPAWAEAIAALESIPMEDWLTKGFFKKYYYAISEILKRYLEGRFEFKAAEQTTTEIAANLKTLRIPQREEFNRFFIRADMVKYAKHVPPHDEMRSAVHIAKDLVMRTRPEDPLARQT